MPDKKNDLQPQFKLVATHRPHLRLILIGVIILYAVFYIQWMVASKHQFLIKDFVAFYAAAEMVQDGRAALTYDRTAIHEVEKKLAGFDCGTFAWYYPPTTLLMIAPLAWLPPLFAFAIWLLLPLSSTIIIVRRILPDPLTAFMVLAAPVVFTNFVYGQNGYLSAVLFAGGLYVLQTHPAIAGLLFATLTYKPQFAFLVPLALLAGQHFKVLAWWFAGLAILILLSLIMLGWASWLSFLGGISLAINVIETGATKLLQMSTISSAILLAGGAPWLARVAQLAFIIFGATVVLVVWHRRDIPDYLKNAVLIIATLLAAPHSFRYDLVLLIPALAWLYRAVQHTGWLPGEKIIYFSAISLSIFTTMINQLINFSLDTIVIAMVLGYAIYRCWKWPINLPTKKFTAVKLQNYIDG